MIPTALLFCLTATVSLPADGDRGAEEGPTDGARIRRPSVVLIVLDDWARSDLEAARTDGVGWNDLIAVDALAARGQTWNRFYSQPVCNPTRMTLMLGKYRGDRGGGVCSPPGVRTPAAKNTLAKIFQRAGYATAAFGKWHIGTSPEPSVPWTQVPAHYGFDAWRAWNASNIGGSCGSVDYSDWHRVDDGDEHQSRAYHTEAVGSAFLDWWQSSEGPRFAYVCFQAPHQPLHAPPSHLLPSGTPPLTRSRDRYEAMLVAFDTVLATMLAVVDLSDTYVVLIADNGTPPAAVRSGQRPGRVKTTTFEDGVNVPMIVAGPGVAVGTTEALGHVVDLPATLADLVGARLGYGMGDSVSLRPVLQDPSARVRRFLICENDELEGLAARRDTCVVLESKSGLVKGRVFEDGLRQTRIEDFYDLVSDPGERRPLLETDPDFADEIADARWILAKYELR